MMEKPAAPVLNIAAPEEVGLQQVATRSEAPVVEAVIPDQGQQRRRRNAVVRRETGATAIQLEQVETQQAASPAVAAEDAAAQTKAVAHRERPRNESANPAGEPLVQIETQQSTQGN